MDNMFWKLNDYLLVTTFVSVSPVSFLSVILLVVSIFGLVMEGKANWYDEFI